ncbi:hypothetical protein ACFSTH_05035 [Paenibacillus yanchengensis]|uniref:Alpha/beta hydrolase n=1 Tax=Paenibacillus yanchengensis TaxID=2035833 RepID=A0ABW4YKA8_9BACL
MSFELHSSLKSRRTWKEYVRDAYRMKYDRDRSTSRFLLGSLFIFNFIAWIVASRGVPTGLGIWLDSIIAATLNVILLVIAIPILSFFMSLIQLPVARKLFSLVIITFIQMIFILQFAELDRRVSYLVAGAYIAIALLLGSWLLHVWRKWRISNVVKLLATLIPAVIIGVVIMISTSWPVSNNNYWLKQKELFSTVSDADVADIAVKDGSLLEQGWHELINPSLIQQYNVTTFSYGNGTDKHRSSFGKQVDYLSPSVNAEQYISKWPKLKQLFWGFSPQELPLNGTVWMPEGADDASFPIALIVHGNHLMEDFSDGGYHYLGEMLAKQGIIAISVDQNFLNYSSWSGIVDNDMLMRAWLLLQHIQQLGIWNSDDSHPLYDKFDLSSIALIGHSRGGQAAAMAADPERFFDDDAMLPDKEDYQIKAVVAMAPTDKKVEDQFADLDNVFYLTLQGARDADVNNFYGERQYARTMLETSERFKAALYIADANHSQFNTDWGKFDERLPGGLFLNRSNMLTAEEQQQIAKVYIAAFLQAALFENFTYTPLFQNYENGLQWLPDTGYISRYENGSTIPIARENGLIEKSYAIGMSEWDESTYAINRDGNSKQQEAIELSWEKAGAEYNMILTDQAAEQLEDSAADSIIFSLAVDPLIMDEQTTDEVNMDRSKTQVNVTDEHLDKESIDGLQDDVQQGELEVPQLEIEVETDEGEILQLLVNDVTSIEAPVHTQFTKFTWLENRIKKNKYKQSAEAIFQTVIVPLNYFSSLNKQHDSKWEKQLNPAQISKISFRFASEAGKVFLADIGYTNREEANEKQF